MQSSLATNYSASSISPASRCGNLWTRRHSSDHSCRPSSASAAFDLSSFLVKMRVHQVVMLGGGGVGKSALTWVVIRLLPDLREG